MTGSETREEICRELGLRGVGEAYQAILKGKERDAKWLLGKGLGAGVLERLGYSEEGMRKIGFDEATLRALGYGGGAERTDAPNASTQSAPERSALDGGELPPMDERKTLTPRELIDAGASAGDLRELRLDVYRCKRMGVDARDLARIGFTLNELAEEFSGQELKTIGFRVHEMKRLFDGRQLRTFGYTASEMRAANYAPRDLLGFGYPENQVVTAGYSTADLLKAGLSVRTADRKKRVF